MTASEPLPRLPARPADGHKGTFGTVGVIGGVREGGTVMLGGPCLSALAALRAGCGLVVLALPETIINEGLAVVPEATGLALPVDGGGRLMPSGVAAMMDREMNRIDALALGPGLGSDEPQQQIVMRLVARDDVPLVVDADALNALARVPDFTADLRAPLVITPHPGEFRKLAEALSMSVELDSEAGRLDAASAMAQRLGCIVVLKGHHTVVSDGMSAHINETGNVAMATGGSGDVLCGVIASLMAQHFKPQVAGIGGGSMSLLDCARIGVHVHGFAGDRWAETRGDRGLIARDLVDGLPDAMATLVES